MSIEKAIAELKATSFHVSNDDPSNSPGGSNALIYVSAEHGDDACDYYGEYRGGFPWINPELEKIAERHGLYWEWINPAGIGLYA